MLAMNRSIGPACPECREPISFWRTQWGLGKSFACRNCGEELIYEKQFVAPILAIVTYFILKPKGGTGTLADHVTILLPLFAGMLFYCLFVMKPRKTRG